MPRSSNNRPPVDSTMEFDVAHAQGSSNPRSYSARYTVSSDGMVIPRNTNPSTHSPRIHLEDNGDGTMQAFIPQLALGTSGGSAYPMMNMASPGESNQWGDTEYFGMWDTVLDQRDGKWDMRRAVRWWHRDPLVYRCIKLLCQLANSKVTFKSEDEDTQKVIDAWFKQAMPYSFRCGFFLEWFRTGYVPILKTLVKYEPRSYKPNKTPKADHTGNIGDPAFQRVRANLVESDVMDLVDEDLAKEISEKEKAEAAEIAKQEACQLATEALIKHNEELEQEYLKAVAEFDRAKKLHKQHKITAARLGYFQNDLEYKQAKWRKGQIPGSYMILDPLQVDLRGPISMAMLREPYLMVPGDLMAAMRSPSELQRIMIEKLPREIVNQIVEGGATYVWLPPNICSIVCQDKMDYQRYPIPMMRHAFDALQMKADLYAMDQATVRGIKNRILLVKVGNDEYPVTDPATIQHVAGVFNSIGRTGSFFWNHCIEMEWIEPDFSATATADKYLHWNAEIRTCFGMTPILTGGGESTGGAIGNQMISFKGVQMEVNGAQQAFIEFLQKEITMVKAALGLSADVEVTFDQINMKDENGFWQVVTQAVMNGILDHQTALEILGFHFPQIKDRMNDMKPLKKKGLFVPQPSANNMGPGGEMKPQGSGGPGGRQKNTKPVGKNKNKTGKSQPKKAKATMRAVGSTVYVLVEAEGGLDQEERQDVANLYGIGIDFVRTTAEFTKMYPDADVTPDWPDLSPLEAVQSAVAASNIVTTAAAEYERLCASYKQENADAGKRVSYLTPQKKTELQVAAKVEAEFKYLGQVANLKELPKGWDRHFDTVHKGLASQLEGVSKDHLEAQAFAMTALRYKKSKL